MDIEQLTKSQIVLLTLLVSFVTSIATGIVTVSLVDQAPPAVAQTVNRVIERTIQAAAPSQAASAVVTQQKTVVVNQSDLVAQAISSVSPSIVRIYTGTASSSAFLALGVVVDASGTIATDESAVSATGSLSAELSSGASVPVEITTRDSTSGVAYLSPATTTATTWSPVKFMPHTPVLGQNVIELAGKTVPSIQSGLVTSVIAGKSGEPTIVSTNIPASDIMHGSALISTGGLLMGVSTGVSRASSPSGFVSVSALSASAPSQSPPSTAGQQGDAGGAAVSGGSGQASQASS